MVAKENGYNFI